MNNELQINNISASSLFHYTKRLSALNLIIKNGVRFSYAFEEYPKTLIQNFCDCSDKLDDLGVAIPMISFCDIPIMRAKEHRDKFGKYLIGFNKEFMLKYYGNILNPLLYVQSSNIMDAITDLSLIHKELLAEHKDLVVNRTDNSFKIPMLALRMYYMRLLIALTKPMYSSDGKKCYYNEREWRAFQDDNKGQFNAWEWGITKRQYNNGMKRSLNKKISSDFDGFITFPEGCIQEAVTHIVVPTEDKIQMLAQDIMNSTKLFGYENVSQAAKLNLISKITSFERIALDY